MGSAVSGERASASSILFGHSRAACLSRSHSCSLTPICNSALAMVLVVSPSPNHVCRCIAYVLSVGASSLPANREEGRDPLT